MNKTVSFQLKSKIFKPRLHTIPIPYSILIFFLFLSLTGHAQSNHDSTLLSKIMLDVSVGNYFIAPYLTPPDNASENDLHIPDIIRDLRKRAYNNPSYDPTVGLDNPLRHNAFYMRFETKTEIAEGFTFYADLIGEHRGFSYGTYSTENLIVFPQVRFNFDTSFYLLKQKIGVFGNVGNFVDTRIHEGLMIYNLDVQGIDFNLSLGKLQFRYFQLTDLFNGIGLNIDDSRDMIFSLTNLSIGDQWKSTIRLGYFNSSELTPQYNGYKLSGAFYTDNIRVYGQFATKTDQGFSDLNTIKNYGALLGTEFFLNREKFELRTRGELRYYGGIFNYGFKRIAHANYRPNRRSSTYGETIGEQLYPIYQYERPFSQWAVYTEYQDDIAANTNIYQQKGVGGAVLQTEATLRLMRNIFISTSIDLNLMLAEGQQPFLYSFFTSGLGIEPAPGNQLMMIITNRGMNLDIHYPTLYHYKYLYYGLSLRREVTRFKKKSMFQE